jgi:hypothetical protein
MQAYKCLTLYEPALHSMLNQALSAGSAVRNKTVSYSTNQAAQPLCMMRLMNRHGLTSSITAAVAAAATLS